MPLPVARDCCQTPEAFNYSSSATLAIQPLHRLPHPASIHPQDDMLFSPDFFSYFEALAPRLDADPTLMCVSAWNDHGQVRRGVFPRRSAWWRQAITLEQDCVRLASLVFLCSQCGSGLVLKASWYYVQTPQQPYCSSLPPK